MAMYYYASKISAIACGTRCKQTVLQKSRGQRDRDKCDDTFCTYHDDDGGCGGGGDDDDNTTRTAAANEMNVNGIELDFHNLEVSTSKTTRRTFSDIGIGSANCDSEIVIYDIPKNSFMRSQSDVNYESSVLGSGGIMYINGKIVSGPLESLTDVLVPKNIKDLDKDFIFSFLLCSRLFIRPHELLGKLLSMVPDSESLELLVALLAEWTNKFPYDFRDERIMSHVKHIVARCSNTGLEGLVSEMLSALLKRLTDLERHEEDLRACQQSGDKANTIDCPTASQYAQILCRLERRLAKHIGPEEFLQCSKNVLLDKQSKKWDQPSTSSGPPGAQDPKKTCNLETYLDWSARLRLFVCNEILQCHCIRERSRIVELWSGVAQYCLLVGNYNSATAILETLESPPIARLKITWSKLSMTCQQLDCMQRHAEGYGNLWNKQAIVLNENHHYQHRHQHHHPPHHHHYQQQQKTDLTSSTDVVLLSSSSSLSTATAPKSTTTATAILTTAAEAAQAAATTMTTTTTTTTTTSSTNGLAGMSGSARLGMGRTTTTPTGGTATKPNDWVVIPVFADIVKLAISGRDDCMQRLPNGHINVTAFDRMAAIVGAFTRHMTEVKSPTTRTAATTTTTEAATGATPSAMDETTTASSSSSTSSSQAYGEYESFCRHMQKTTTLNESELMMASFDCEKPNNAEKLMYDLN